MSQAVNSYRDLLVWQETMTLTEQIYRFASTLPQNERYELSSQLRRAAASIPSTIAEGYVRESRGAYVQFLKIARGSRREAETQLLLCARLQQSPQQSTDMTLAHCDKVGRLLHGLM